jgi:hypothetical protein
VKNFAKALERLDVQLELLDILYAKMSSPRGHAIVPKGLIRRRCFHFVNAIKYQLPTEEVDTMQVQNAVTVPIIPGKTSIKIHNTLIHIQRIHTHTYTRTA